jgi:molybdopterin adenylyltransferase
VSVTEHRAHSPASVRCAVVTVSDTRTFETDTSGRTIADRLVANGHVVASRDLVPDEPAQLRALLERLLDTPGVQAILTTGGTGISARDGTYEAIDALLEKRLDGFGELFRVLSYQEIGAAAMLSRACAGLARQRVIVAMPGSQAAVQLAMDTLVLPELGHLVREATR